MARTPNNLIGLQFGLWKVLEYNGKSMWKCECQCEHCIKHNKIIKSISGGNLKSGASKSCGCTKSNLSHTRIYRIWGGMKRRCNDIKNDSYNNYGGKGITICDDWYDFINFYNWAINNNYQDNFSIDRIDSNGNYEPSNCQWIEISSNIAKSNIENIKRKSNKGRYYGISPNQEYIEFDNATIFSKEYSEYELNPEYIRACANKKAYKNGYKGWMFGFVNTLGKT